MGMCRSAVKAINCQRLLCHNFKASSSVFARSAGLHSEESGARSFGEDMFSISLFLSPVSLWLWLGFFLSSQTRQTSDPTPDWPASLRSPQQLASQAARLSPSRSVSRLPLSWLCSRVGWFGMTISQGRNADNRSELPGVAASQLTRNKAFLTD